MTQTANIDRQAAARALGEWLRDNPGAAEIPAFRVGGETLDLTDLREAEMLVLVDVVLGAALRA